MILVDELRQDACRLMVTTLHHLVHTQPERLTALYKTAGPLDVDFSKQRLDVKTLNRLIDWAKERGLEQKIKALFNGEVVNVTENRPALHPSLRGTCAEPELLKTVSEQTAKMLRVAEQLRSGNWPGLSGRPVNSLICLGIGGSDLGPRMVHDSLHTAADFTVRFVANVDPAELDQALIGLEPGRTAVAIISKTFTTRETLANAAAVKAWLASAATNEKQLSEVLLGVTAAPARAVQYGIKPENVLEFHEAIGGRFSLWSSVGLGIAASCGSEVFKELLAGAAALDKHFRDTPLEDNLPAVLGLISIWNRAFLSYQTQAIIPYAERLRFFPAWLQQLIMESNGKAVLVDGRSCELATAPVIWGSSGTNAQHAFFQQLHQGPDIVPVDFIVAKQATAPQAFPGDERHQILIANCFAQAATLAFGYDTIQLSAHRSLPGDRPSTIIMIDKLDAYNLGALLACYEHATFSAAAVLGINPFDQFGVEHGKVVAQSIERVLAGDRTVKVDPATSALIRKLRA